jgi:DNA replication and repair protein RecF
MILQNLAVKNFRIHQDSEINCSPSLNFIIGGNGEGKTSLIEAIYSLCTTKNYKGASDTELTRFNEPGYEVAGIFYNNAPRKVRIIYSAGEGKRNYVLDGKTVFRSSEVIGKFPVVLLTPDDYVLTQGSPADRRKFVDSVISQSSEYYLSLLIEYNRIIKQRTALLNAIREFRQNDYLEELDAWDTQLVKIGTSLIRYRQKFIAEFQTYITEAYRFIMENEELPGVEYPVLRETGGTITEEIFAAKLSARRDEEIRRAANLVGPHRDDFIFSVNGKSLKTYGSQGQHKTFQVALRFAQFFYLKEKSSGTPVFLLDDVFGELDTKRSIKISAYLREVGQAFITITDFSNYGFLSRLAGDMIIRVTKGTVAYE